MRKICWWNNIIEPNNEEVAKAHNKINKNVDLVLKSKEIFLSEKKIILTDHLGNLYTLILSVVPALKVNKFIKLRRINVHFSEEGWMIILTEFTTCLLLKNSFFDAKLFNKDFYKSNIQDLDKIWAPMWLDNEGFNKRSDVLAIYPYMKDYYFSEILLGKSSFITNPCYDFIQSDIATLLKKQYNNRIPVHVYSLIKLSDKRKEETLF